MHPKAYAIVEKESGKILLIVMSREKARLILKDPKQLVNRLFKCSIIPVEIRKLKK